MFHRMVIQLLLALVVTQASFGGVSGVLSVCFGGGHEHGAADQAHCESVCSHHGDWFLPRLSDDPDHGCECIDVEISVVDLRAIPCTGWGAQAGKIAIALCPDWGIVIADSGLGRRGPPVLPPWFDPSNELRLELLSGVILTI